MMLLEQKKECDEKLCQYIKELANNSLDTIELKKYAYKLRDLYAQGCTGSDFKNLEAQARECSIRRMALFYGLTATAARAEEIRRMR